MPLTATLRMQAEQRLAQEPSAAPFAAIADPVRLVHELQVHQLELEMQNAHLQQLQVELEQARDRYIDLFDYAPVGHLSLSLDGTIIDANLTASLMLGVAHGVLPSQRLGQFISAEDSDTWHCCLRALRLDQHRGVCCLKLLVRDGCTTYVRVHLAYAPIHQDAPLRAILIDISEADYLVCRPASTDFFKAQNASGG